MKETSVDFTKDIDKDIAVQVLKKASTGIALFDATTLDLFWCNSTFKKQTWFGSAGRDAIKINIKDFFEENDHKLIHDLFNIALSLGQAYDFQRQVKKGAVGSFPAEIKLHKVILSDEKNLVCIEILDLSVTKMYDDLQFSYSQVSEKMADLMAAQAELRHSVRMNTISEVGSDIAHQLINPITMCRGILETQIYPVLTSMQSIDDMNKALKYLYDIQDLAIWFRKFSDPKIFETQILKITAVINDALMLNVNRFTSQGITYKIRKETNYSPSTLTNPVNFIMWINAAFAELISIISLKNNIIYIDINGNDDVVHVIIQCASIPQGGEKITVSTLEKFVQKMPGSAQFETNIQEKNIAFSLSLKCFKEEQENPAAEKNDVMEINPHVTEKPLVFIVDDEQDIRRLIKRAMKQAGWETLEAEDGIQALEFFQNKDKKSISNRIVAIISDVRMPRMTGPHFLVALREEKIEIPFIFFSSNLVDKGDNSFKYNNVFYLTKEEGLEELKKLVSKCMPTSSSLQK